MMGAMVPRLRLAAALLASLVVSTAACAQGFGALAPDAQAGAGTVVLLSFDGVRPDYLGRGPLPALERIEREGLRAEALTPVFPASTFPSHVSLATCAPVDRHGIVANRFHDTARGEFDYANDASWILAEPLWAAAERQGVRAATFFWVGSETDWEGVGASLRRAPFDSGVQEAEKVDQILAWLDLPAAQRPRLIASWWHGADRAGHRHGPDAEPVAAALAAQDRELARLLAGLDARGAWDTTTLLIVSDHGMAAATERFDVRRHLAAKGIEARVQSGGGFANVYLEEPARAGEVVAALAEVPRLSAWPRDAVPGELRYAHPTRVGDVFILAEPPLLLASDRTVGPLTFKLVRLIGRTLGTHGYDPARHPEMRGVLLGMGRGIAPGTRLGVVSSLDVAPTVTHLLGIEPPRDCEGAPIEGVGTPP